MSSTPPCPRPNAPSVSTPWRSRCSIAFMSFFFRHSATSAIYTLSLHDALPISPNVCLPGTRFRGPPPSVPCRRSEEHTSELQSRLHLVCRLLLEKKKSAQTPREPHQIAHHPRHQRRRRAGLLRHPRPGDERRHA